MDKNTGISKIKRISMIVLSLIVAVSLMPVFASAYDDAPDNAVNTEIQAAETESSLENVSIQDELTDLELVETDDILPDPDEMLKEYIDSKIDDETGTVLKEHTYSGSGDMSVVKGKAKLATRRTYLSSDEKEAYDQIKPYIQKIASGSMDSAAFYISDVPGASYKTVISALMTDMPYEFYWHDKVEGYLHGTVSGGRHLFIMAVSKDYWNPSVCYYYNGYSYVYGLNTIRTKSTDQAVTNVSHIINEFADKSDIDKLFGYKNRICEFTQYDKSAAYQTKIHGSDPFYGDPWQLISVFDGDDGTNVVCEGYSKAFQYLCDRTQFSSGIECLTVQGEIFQNSSYRGEGHMWNILHMDDGGNYIADITNCDNSDGSLYYSSELFLTGWSPDFGGSVETGYTYYRGVLTIRYEYDDFTKGGNGAAGMFTESELTLSNTNYSIGEPAVTFCPSKAATCTDPGNTDRWLKLGYYYEDEDCTRMTTYSETTSKPLGHDWDEGEVIKEATETSEGILKYTCKRNGCHETKEERLGILPHTHHYTVTDSFDTVIYRCACGDSYTQSKVVVDRPKVSIKKAVSAKEGFTAKWKKLSAKSRKKITGYEIQYSTRRDFADAYSLVKTASRSKTSKKIGKLAKKKAYYVRVRSYKWINGVKHVSKWSSVKKVRTK